MTNESHGPFFMRYKNDMLVLFVRPSARYSPQNMTDVRYTKWVLPKYFYYDIK
jgi:hypothetical protein